VTALHTYITTMSATAYKLPEGTYRITNVESRSSVRVHNAGDIIHVSSSRENPGPFELVSRTMFCEYTRYMIPAFRSGR